MDFLKTERYYPLYPLYVIDMEAITLTHSAA